MTSNLPFMRHITADFIEHITAPVDGVESVYLTRIHLTPFSWWKLPRIYIHIFSRPDEDREFHDHPWGFKTVVLWGGYDEISHRIGEDGKPTGEIVEDTLHFLSSRDRPATHAHKITRLHTKKVVTLVVRDNTKQRDWGFWLEKGEIGGVGKHAHRWVWVRWQDYIAARSAG